jgi:hypothetical protein
VLMTESPIGPRPRRGEDESTMERAEHTFHTRHDFTPELGWAAFQLLGALGAEGARVEALEQAARTLASPMARRSDLRKLLRSMEELGLLASGSSSRRRVAPCQRRRGGTSPVFAPRSTACTRGAGCGTGEPTWPPRLGATSECAERSGRRARSGSSRMPSS